MVYYIVGAYLGGNERIVLNTSATHPLGMNAFTKTYFVINTPYSPEIIGGQLKQVVQNCLDNPIWNESMAGDLSKLLGFKSEGKFNKEFFHVVIKLIKEKELLVFTPTKREGNGYVNNGPTTFEVSLNDSEKEIGQTLLDTFKLCKK